MVELFSVADKTTSHPREGSVNGAEDTRGMIVPLPVLFILLMILVIFAVYDILQKSQDLHDEANRRVARAVLENTLTRANSGLNG